MIRQIRVELLKLTTVRFSYGLLAFAAALTGIFTAIEASRAGTSNGVAPLNTYAGLSAIVTGGVWGLMFAAVLGVTISSGEFRHQTATLTYLAAPDRTRVLAAKAVVAAAGGAVFGLVVDVVATGVGLGFVAGHHYPVSIGVVSFVRFALGHLVGGALMGSLGAVVGSLVRSQLAAVIGVFVWSIILESLIGGLFTSIRPYLPYTAATSLAGTALGAAGFGPSRGVSGGAPLPFAATTALLAGLTILLAVVAARTTVRRDVA
jgi:ABC-type transport system involved in multi-copper enzyme maturation permease subunit